MNHWFYILVEGKTGVDDNGVAYAVQGIGYDKASQIVYRMETNYLTPNSAYSDARIAAIQSATDLFGASSNETIQTRNAWNAVGVYNTNVAPGNLSASGVSTTSVMLTWLDRAEDETGFIIERSTSLNNGFVQVATTAANIVTYTDTELPTNTIYYYRVRTSFDDDPSSYSNVATVAIGEAPVVMSTTTLVTCGSTLLDPGGLSDYSNNQYHVMRLEPGEVGKKIKIVFTSFDMDLYDFLYIYDGDYNSSNLIGSFSGNTIPASINATNAAGALTLVFSSNWFSTRAGWQATISCETLPANPTNLSVTTASSTQLNLAWTDNAADETAYEIQRKITGSPAPFAEVGSVASNTTSFEDTGLPTNQRYMYRVRALKGTTYSGFSNSVTGTVGNPPLAMTDGTFQLCNSVFLDPGGYGSYNNSQYVTTTVWPNEPNKALQVSFSSFSLESCCDRLWVYDGINSSAPQLGSFSGTDLPSTLTALNSDGALTFVFSSDYSVVSTGWEATLTCVVKPEAPSDLTITSSSASQISLAWQDNELNETNVILERKDYSSGSNYQVIATLAPNTTSYTDSDISDNERYYYRVSVISGTVRSSYSNVAEVTIGVLPLVMRNETLATCSGVFMDPGGNGNYNSYGNVTMTLNPEEVGKKIKVSFSSFSLNGGAELSIYDGSSITENNLIGTFTGNSLPPTINALNDAGSLTFRFINNYGSGFGWAASISCETIPNAPSNLQATTTSTTQINLSWTDNSTNETGFAVERKSANSPGAEYARIVVLGANTTSYSDAGLVTDNRYFYRVRSLSGTTYSAVSNIANAVVGTETYVMQPGIISACGGRFLDPGGSGNYPTGYTTMTILPLEEGKKVKVSFSQFAVNTNDFLAIYDGTINSENLIGRYTGTNLPSDVNALNAQGSLTFEFSSSYFGSAGWRATLTCETLPVAPGNLTATKISDSQIDLSWSDNSADETGFAIERRAGSNVDESFSRITTVAANTTTYQNAGLTTNERYTYRVRALRGTTYGASSGVANAVVGVETVPMRSGTFNVCNVI